MEIKLSVYQEIFLRSHIRTEIKRLDKIIESYRSQGLETSMVINNKLDMEQLYHRLLDEYFRD